MRLIPLLCHGKEERCLDYRNHKFPLCARCTGIYLGFITVLLFEMLVTLPPGRLLPVYLALGVPATIDGVTQLIGSRESSNPLRIATGFAGGVGLMLFIRSVRPIFLV